MRYYADTGFLLSLHLQETTSATAAALVQTISEPLPVTPLIALEFRNALRLASFARRLLRPSGLRPGLRLSKTLPPAPSNALTWTPARVHVEAESLCDQFTAITGVRTLDLLHVAYARVLGRTEFLSF